MICTAVDQKPKSGTNLKRLRNVRENPRVTMLADEYSDDWDTLWWVRADGRAVILAEPRQMAEPLRLLAERYWQYREAPPTGPVLAVTVERWSGWAAAGSLLLLGPPAAVQLNELVPLLRGQVFRLQAPGSRMVSRIWARYSVQCGHPARWRSKRCRAGRDSEPSR